MQISMFLPIYLERFLAWLEDIIYKCGSLPYIC